MFESVHLDLGITTGPHGPSVVPGLRTLYNSIQDQVILEFEEKGGLSGEGGAIVLVFFISSHSVTEQRSIELLYGYIFNTEFQTEWSRRSLRQNLNQRQWEDLLLRTGAIKGYIHSHMSTARTVRNVIVHHPHSHTLSKFDNSLNIVKQTINTVEELEEMVVDYYLLDEMSRLQHAYYFQNGV